MASVLLPPSPSAIAEVAMLLDVLPPRLKDAVLTAGGGAELIEIVMDLGRPAELRTHGGGRVFEDIEIDQADLDQVVAHIGEFGDDNRAGIARTLHRISGIRNRQGRLV